MPSKAVRNFCDGCPQPVQNLHRSETGFIGAMFPRCWQRQRWLWIERVWWIESKPRRAGNYGWPYFIGNNFPYNDYDYVNNKSPLYDPKNQSTRPLTTQVLKNCRRPIPHSTIILTHHRKSFRWGEGGRNAMASPVFYKDRFPESTSRFQITTIKKLFTYDWCAVGWWLLR